jgi:hypothetical protein
VVVESQLHIAVVVKNGRQITGGEEVTVDYGRLRPEEVCHCGSENCRGKF